MDKNNNTANGIGFTGLLLITFIILKLTHVIDWSWVWVLSPSWIPLSVSLLVCAVVIIYSYFKR